MRTIIVFALIAALCHAGGAQARDQLGQRDAVTIDPQRAYIYYRSFERLTVNFIREVSEAERAEWIAAREAAFPQAAARNARAIARWDREGAECQGRDAFSPFCQGRGPRPEPLTMENFPFPAPETDNFVAVEGGRPFTRSETENSYFIAVEPGTYILYGSMAQTSNGNVGVCMCMGSVKFEARAGEIVDIGEIRFPRNEAVREGREWSLYGPNRLSTLSVDPATDAMLVPDRLAGFPMVRAELRAADKLTNYFALEIDRHPEIPGILSYERDRVIDARTGNPVTPAP